MTADNSYDKGQHPDTAEAGTVKAEKHPAYRPPQLHQVGSLAQVQGWTGPNRDCGASGRLPRHG